MVEQNILLSRTWHGDRSSYHERFILTPTSKVLRVFIRAEALWVSIECDLWSGHKWERVCNIPNPLASTTWKNAVADPTTAFESDVTAILDLAYLIVQC